MCGHTLTRSVSTKKKHVSTYPLYYTHRIMRLSFRPSHIAMRNVWRCWQYYYCTHSVSQHEVERWEYTSMRTHTAVWGHACHIERGKVQHLKSYAQPMLWSAHFFLIFLTISNDEVSPPKMCVMWHFSRKSRNMIKGPCHAQHPNSIRCYPSLVLHLSSH